MKRIKFLLATLILLLSIFMYGCTDTAKEDSKTVETKKETAKKTEEKKEVEPTEGFLDEKVTLTYLYPLGVGFQVVDSMNDNAVIKVVNELKNVDIEFIHPPNGQEAEQFNLILVSDDLPDIITHGWGIPQKFPGGPAKAISDGVYISLNEYMDYAPNLSEIISEFDNVRKDITTDDGDIWGFPMIDKTVQPQWTGPTIRKDMFDKLNLDTPTTISQWYDALSAFIANKDMFPAMEAPFIMKKTGYGGFSAFIGAYDVNSDFIQIDGVVKFGPLQDGFKEYLVEMNKWYDEGLIHPDFAAGIDENAYLMTDKCAAVTSAGFWQYDSLKAGADNPDFRIIGAPYPSLAEGEKVQISYMARRSHLGYHTPITTACENVERAVDWMDWFYSQEGSHLANWGTEGDTYYVADDGSFRYTDKIVNNEEGVGLSILYFKYFYSHGAFLREWDRECHLYGTDAIECQYIWLDSSESNHMIPTFADVTVEESDTFTGIMGDVSTYVSEMMVKYITGQESFDTYPQFISTIEKMNIAEATTIKQASFERFNKR